MSSVAKVEEFDFDFDEDDDEPDLGSQAMFEAIFKKANKRVSLSSADLKKVKEDAAKYLSKSSTKEMETRTPKKKRRLGDNKEQSDEMEVQQAVQKKSAAAATVDDVGDDDLNDLDLSQESRDLLKSCKDLLRDPADVDTRESEESDPEDCPVWNCKNTSRGSYKAYECDEEEEEEQVQKVIDNTRQQHGELILCQVVFDGKKYPLKIYENQTIAEVRELILNKIGIAKDEWLDLFHGNFTVLDDRLKVKEYGIKCLDDIDAFVKNISEKQMFISGSDSILRFKLQTDDRKGRSTSTVYIKKSATMREAVKKYCEEHGLDPTKVRLKFDGDIVSLDATPEECDLEGDECLDVIVS